MRESTELGLLPFGRWLARNSKNGESPSAPFGVLADRIGDLLLIEKKHSGFREHVLETLSLATSVRPSTIPAGFLGIASCKHRSQSLPGL
jgi:hypothetical protein